MNQKTLPHFDFSQQFIQNFSKASQNFQQALNKLNISVQGEKSRAYPFDFAKVFSIISEDILSTPEKSLNFMMQLNQAYMQIFANVVMRSNNQEDTQLFPPFAKDKRFNHEQWHKNPYYDFLVQSFTFTSNFFINLIDNNESIGAADKRKYKFFLQQLFNALAPSNYIFSNPKVLEETVNSAGENLVKGSENF